MRRIKSIVLSFGVLAVGTMALNCACSAAPKSPAPGASPSASARLTSTGVDNVTLFGDWSDDALMGTESPDRTAIRQHSFAEEGDDFDPDVNGAGQMLVFASTRHQEQPDLYLQSVDGVVVTQLTSEVGSDVQPAFSPDGKRVAFASDRSGSWDIWTVGIDGTQLIQVTRGPGDDFHPSWSPDGQRLVFSRLPANRNQWEMWIAKASADGAQQFIGNGLFPEWSPEGSRILFQQARQRGSRWFSVWTVTLVNGEPRNPTEIAASAEGALISPTWSPDGRSIAYTSVMFDSMASQGAPAGPGMQAGAGGGKPEMNRGANSTSAHADSPAPSLTDASIHASDVWVVNVDGRDRRRMSGGRGVNMSPVFGADGRLYFVADRAGRMNVWSLPMPGAASVDPARLTAMESPLDAPGRAEAHPADPTMMEGARDAQPPPSELNHAADMDMHEVFGASPEEERPHSSGANED